LFAALLPEEQALLTVIRAKGKVDIDALCMESQLAPHRAASLLLNLEFNGVVRSLPGKVYALN
ncbi:MAG TPA: DNA-protecting protein DprA, partial [Flavobacteriales bacterium]|nr:DNA-protecting protein DprA [Flavobacteriales bacterium]